MTFIKMLNRLRENQNSPAVMRNAVSWLHRQTHHEQLLKVLTAFLFYHTEDLLAKVIVLNFVIDFIRITDMQHAQAQPLQQHFSYLVDSSLARQPSHLLASTKLTLQQFCESKGWLGEAAIKNVIKGIDAKQKEMGHVHGAPKAPAKLSKKQKTILNNQSLQQHHQQQQRHHQHHQARPPPIPLPLPHPPVPVPAPSMSLKVRRILTTPIDTILQKYPVFNAMFNEARPEVQQDYRKQWGVDSLMLSEVIEKAAEKGAFDMNTNPSLLLSKPMEAVASAYPSFAKYLSSLDDRSKADLSAQWLQKAPSVVSTVHKMASDGMFDSMVPSAEGLKGLAPNLPVPPMPKSVGRPPPIPVKLMKILFDYEVSVPAFGTPPPKPPAPAPPPPPPPPGYPPGSHPMAPTMQPAMPMPGLYYPMSYAAAAAMAAQQHAAVIAQQSMHAAMQAQLATPAQPASGAAPQAAASAPAAAQRPTSAPTPAPAAKVIAAAKPAPTMPDVTAATVPAVTRIRTLSETAATEPTPAAAAAEVVPSKQNPTAASTPADTLSPPKEVVVDAASRAIKAAKEAAKKQNLLEDDKLVMDYYYPHYYKYYIDALMKKGKEKKEQEKVKEKSKDVPEKKTVGLGQYSVVSRMEQLVKTQEEERGKWVSVDGEEEQKESKPEPATPKKSPSPAPKTDDEPPKKLEPEPEPRPESIDSVKQGQEPHTEDEASTFQVEFADLKRTRRGDTVEISPKKRKKEKKEKKNKKEKKERREKDKKRKRSVTPDRKKRRFD
eukprot:TRINITY_DN17418_c0_g1_i1.p1 TRINITY_DN17418_c0_g1~~TRINITY_DN17418_c0_g1_i1.p1  ORF type:complete len:772 (+),score=214.72 TRINITY_DN17418_c0_g1_i1:327-2642(+)